MRVYDEVTPELDPPTSILRDLRKEFFTKGSLKVKMMLM